DVDKELSSGGQGIVYKTREPNVLLKLEWNRQTKKINTNVNENEKYEMIRLLPFSANSHITLPQSILKDCVGYSMRLLDDMISFESAFRYGNESYRNEWLLQFEYSNPEFAKGFGNYISTGGRRRRMEAFMNASIVFASLHTRGLVYCDISDKNMYVSESKDNAIVWMIDVDNVNFISETSKRAGIYSPGYVAPEVLRGKGNTFYSDVFSYAISLFWNLTGNHPFVGPALDDKLEQEDILEIPEETYACRGDISWIRDDEDERNKTETAIAYEMIVGEKLHRCFQKTFGKDGRANIQNRPTMMEWAATLAEELDHSIKCEKCEMEYDANKQDICPWCDTSNKYIDICTVTQNENETNTKWEYQHEIAEKIKIPLRVISGFKMSESDSIAFIFSSENSEITLSNFSDKFVFVVEQFVFFRKIY
ncbi:MAG: protein kinase domain-containing protein, partial [Suipraeoptans sp.]